MFCFNIIVKFLRNCFTKNQNLKKKVTSMENKRNGDLKHFGPAKTVIFLEIITVKGFLNFSVEMAFKIFNINQNGY